jgi:hypothetical protein
VVVTTTRRGLIRVALIAAETAERFRSERLGIDPMAWMLAPRRMFGGGNAVESCLERSSCVRALLLHGLGLGLDGEPEALDALAVDDEADVQGAGERDATKQPVIGPRLYTSTVVEREADGWLHLFHAAVANSMDEARSRLKRSHGVRVVDAADTIEGFRPDLPLADVLLSPALADMLEQVDRDPASPLAAGLDICVAQRFAS